MTTVNDFFLHNWRVGTSLETSYLTDIAQSADALTEERRGLLARPRRVMSAHWTGIKRDEANRLLMEILRGGVQQLLVPYYCDQSFTTATSSGTTINCDTTLRHFTVGAQGLIFALDRDGRPTNAQVFTIDGLASGAITTHAALTGSFTAGALVFPLMLAEIMLTNTLDLVTDQVADLSLSFYEVLGSGLPDTAGAGSSTTITSQNSSANPQAAAATPILNVSPDFGSAIKVTAARVGTRHGLGRDSVLDTQGARPVLEHSFRLLLANRAAAWSYQNFFDSVRGRLLPWWLVNPLTLYALVASGTNYIDVAVSGQLQNVSDFVEYIAVVMKDGTIYIRKVTSVTLVSGNWRFAVTLAALDPTQIERVTSAHFVRSAKDASTVQYTTDGLAQVEVQSVEVLAELAASSESDTLPSNCFAPGDDCIGTWRVCLVAWSTNPAAISFDCSPCLFGYGYHQIVVNPGDSCTQSLAILASPCPGVGHTNGSCPPFSDAAPIPLAPTFGDYVLVFSGSLLSIPGTIHVYANMLRISRDTTGVPLDPAPRQCEHAGGGDFLTDDRGCAPIDLRPFFSGCP